jgi:hypothetical protein
MAGLLLLEFHCHSHLQGSHLVMADNLIYICASLPNSIYLIAAGIETNIITPTFLGAGSIWLFK